MATTTTYTSDNDRAGGLQSPAGGYISATFDCALDNQGAGDIYQLLKIPAGMMVHDVGIIVLTVEDSAATLDVGDGNVADGWLDGVNAAVLGSSNTGAYNSLNDASEYKGGKYYSSADTIDVKFVAACDTLKFIIYAHVSKPRV